MFVRVPRRLGMSLVELLVVIAILAILLAVLFPAIMRVRAVAEKQEDVENLRVLGQAWMAYAHANNGRTLVNKANQKPDAFDDWIKKLEKYVDDLDSHLVSPG